MSKQAPKPENISKFDLVETKRLPFKHSRDEKIVAFSSTTNPFDDFNPSSFPRIATSALASNEMHEDIEEIDALLYS
ncbi:hypothetical protein KSP39_PZI006398 [Platanthera zijinensis]|uniref:Uncharacterized protein n=1 Tax=Platanthera zijinensis TaxID=2320716 RepID=A0AAP0GA41_9ASPA